MGNGLRKHWNLIPPKKLQIFGVSWTLFWKYHGWSTYPPNLQHPPKKWGFSKALSTYQGLRRPPIDFLSNFQSASNNLSLEPISSTASDEHLSRMRSRRWVCKVGGLKHPSDWKLKRTPPKTTLESRPKPEGKGSFPNHHFPGAMFVLGRVNANWKLKTWKRNESWNIKNWLKFKPLLQKWLHWNLSNSLVTFHYHFRPTNKGPFFHLPILWRGMPCNGLV